MCNQYQDSINSIQNIDHIIQNWPLLLDNIPNNTNKADIYIVLLYIFFSFFSDFENVSNGNFKVILLTKTCLILTQQRFRRIKLSFIDTYYIKRTWHSQVNLIFAIACDIVAIIPGLQMKIIRLNNEFKITQPVDWKRETQA